MSSHRRARSTHHGVRRFFTAAVVAVVSATGFLALAEPAHAATAWFVKPALMGGNNAAACTSNATACATITGALAKPTFANGDTITVAAGTYNERPVFTKSAIVTGAGTNSLTGTVINGQNTAGFTTVTVATAGVTVNLNDLQITGGNQTGGLFGGGLRVGTNAGVASAVTGNNVLITGNKSTAGGGAIVWTGASLTLTNSTISNNQSTGSSAAGGGVYNIGALSLTNSTITGNTVSGAGSIGGGGIYSQGGTNVLNGSTVSSNSGPLGGGMATVNLTATNVSWQNNTGTSSGGALYANSTTGINVTGGSFTQNSAPIGGAVATAGGTSTTISGASFSNNSATSNGGAVYNTGAGVTTQLTNNAFSSNSAVLGGAVFVNQGTVTIGTAAANSGGTISNNTATNVGGAGYVIAGATLNVNNATLSNNTAPNGGGAIGNAGPLNITNSSIAGSTGNLGGAIVSTGATVLNGTTISNSSTPAATGQGGGIWSNNSLTLTNSSVTGSSANQGGGVYSTGPLTLTNATVNGNSNSGTVSSQQGGGIVATGLTNITNSQINNNTSGNQAGGLVSSGTVNLSGTTVDGNTAPLGGGLVSSGPLTITGGSVSNNSAQSSTLAANAGGMFVSGVTNIDGTAINGNKALGGSATNSGNAGGIYYANAVTIKNATMTGNYVTLSSVTGTGVITGYGGATFGVTFAAAVTPKLTLTDTTVDGGNVSGGNAFIGGALAVYPNTISGGTTGEITGTRLTLTKNVAQAAGAIYTGGKLTLTDSTVDHNKASLATNGHGGAIYAGGSPIVLDNTDVVANTAGGSGGGLFILAGSTTEIRNGSTVNGNTAVSGGGAVTGGLLTVKDSAVEGNNASFAGAGLYTGGNTTVQNTTIDNNSAAAFGGGLAQVGGSLTMTGGHVNGNDAYAGGGVLVGNSLVSSLDGTDLKNNVSTGTGGGAVASAGQLSIKNATVSGNTANVTGALGGAIYSGTDDAAVTTSLKIDSSTFTDNEAYAASVLVASSSAADSTNKTSINNSTISSNSSSSTVGAIYQAQGLTITNSTVTDNTATGTGAIGALVLLNRGATNLAGNVFSGNTGNTCFRKTNAPADNTNPGDGGYNHLPAGDTSCNLSNQVQSGDPKIGALANNGGPTQTQLPTPSSPLLDKIPAGTAAGISDAISGAAITLCGAGATDQRGESRPAGAKCDIGAVEKAQVAPTINGPTAATYSVGNAGLPLDYTTTGSPQPTLSATGLPSGVTLVDHGDGTATISGTPAAGTGGVYNVTVKATNEAGNATVALTLTVNQAPTIGGPAAATYTVGQPGSTQFTQTTGHPLGTFTSQGLLPNGVTFDGSTAGQGTYSGTPASGTGGVYNLTVKDDNGTPPAATAPFALTINEAAGLTGPAAATFQVGTAGLSGEYTATGFPVPALSATGLPTGLGLVSTGTGKVKISGTAANGQGGVFNATVRASNGVAADQTVNTTVTVNEAPELVGPSVARWVTGVSTTVNFVSDGYPQASLTKTGTLPANLHFVDNGDGTATISGTATAADLGTYSITVKASNGINPDASQTVTIEVVPPLSITTTSLPSAAYKTAYSKQVMVAGGQPPYHFTISAGALPAGLTINDAGLITGSTTAAPGTYTFTVKATDSLDPAQTSTKQLSITVVKGATSLKTAPILATFSSNGDIKINIALFEADLKGGFPLVGIAGEQVQFFSGGKKVCQANTDANGHVKCQPDLLTALLVPIKGEITAKYAGNTFWLPSQSSAGLIGS